ncbi:MAG TPA: hypothetical protein PKD64_03715 [Pirellulaceae bacterium]|nr:hypothetical protein [Pirellulaceae bacterium]HMO91278.1 hypothetical protein [Pirellulaceae bacterium]HMP68538.1 hypothetical protein [Pirellulaceae bacterium]
MNTKSASLNAFLFLALLLVSGCGPNRHPQAQRLIGLWELSTDVNDLSDASLTRDSLASKAMAESRKIDRTVELDDLMTIEFKSNAQLQTKAMQIKQGTWHFVSYSPADDTVQISCRLANEEPVTIDVRFIQDDLMIMIPPNIHVLGKEMLFRRQFSSNK